MSTRYRHAQSSSRFQLGLLLPYTLHALRPLATMNKLRKPKPSTTICHSPLSSTQTAGSSVNQSLVSVQSKPPVSRTMQIASASLAVERTSTSNNTLEYSKATWYSAPATARPHTFVEHYWAARALVAETVLTTRVQHQKEMAEVRLGEEEKRTASICIVSKNVLGD